VRRPLTILVAFGALLLSACGNSRTPVPNLNQPAAPSSFRPLAFTGVALEAPSNWSVVNERAPLVTVVASGTAVVALWRFPRSAPVPIGGAALSHATSQLISAARARDPSLQVIRASAVTVDRAPAIELDAFERINGQPRRVRSTHVFVPGAELVLDEYAPAAIFHMVDHAVFSPVKRSLRLVPGAR
jgi:hypothetical protein